ncbi:MAG: hypothetical protein M1581_04935 [Candidatus Thermoplasmatota archaeon]|jgi:hypothetical protein|nr:hypothetical protein [Candidatus Thermoplasmatota archaeon]
MKVIAVVDEEDVLTPLEYGNTIVEIDTETKQKKFYENPGFGSPFQGKERAMAGILTLNADAIIVKEGVLCPGSYMMSKGKMKYIPVEEEKLQEIEPKLNDIAKKATPELDFNIYRE